MATTCVHSTKSGNVSAITYNPSINCFVIGDTDGNITIYNKSLTTQTGQSTIQQDEDDGPYPITGLAYFNKQILSATCDLKFGLSIKVEKDGSKASVRKQVQEFDNTANATAVASEAGKFAIIGDSNKIVLFDPESDSNEQPEIVIPTLKEPHSINFATYDSTGQFLSVHGTNGTVYIVDTWSETVSTALPVLPTISHLYPSLSPKTTTVTCQSAFNNQFQGATLSYVVTNGDKLLVYTPKNWSKKPTEIQSPGHEKFVAVAFSPNNAILVALTNSNTIHVIDMIHPDHPIVGTVQLPSEVTTPLTHISWGSSTTQNDPKNVVDVVVGGVDGVVVGVANLLSVLPTAKINHFSIPSEISSYLSSVLSTTTPLKSKLAEITNDSSDDDDDDIIVRTASKKPPQTTTAATSTVPGSAQKRKSMANDKNNDVESFDLGDEKEDKTASNKRQKPNSYQNNGSDEDDDDDDDGAMGDGEDKIEEVDLRTKVSNFVVPQNSTIPLDDITTLIRDDLDDYFTTQFRKNYVTARNTELQRAFMPTSTQPHITNPVSGDELTLLNASEHGTIISRLHDGNCTIGVSLHTTKRVEKISLPFNDLHYSMATMDQFGIALAQPLVVPGGRKKSDKKLTIPSSFLYQAFDDDRGVSFSCQMSLKESITCIALSKDVVAVGTSRNFIRIYDLSGVEVEIISVPGEILTMTAKGPYLAVFYHNNSVPLANSHNISMQLIHTETLHVLYESMVPITPMSKLQWVYISPTGLLYTGDSDKIIRLFSTARGNSWKVVCDLSLHVEEREYSLWPVYVEYAADATDPKASSQPQQNTWSHRIFSYELYKRNEPIPSANMPVVKSTKMQIPFSQFQSPIASENDKKVQEICESTVRQRYLWDELISTHGTSIPTVLNRQLDTPWVQTAVRLMQAGNTIRAISAAKQIRDVDIFKKFIEKTNTMTQLPDLDNTIKELTKILQFKQQFKKLGLFPYQQPLPHAAMYRSKEIASMAIAPAHVPVNPFSSPQIQRTAQATSGFTHAMNDTNPSPAPSNRTPTHSNDNPFKTSAGNNVPTPSNNNPFRK